MVVSRNGGTPKAFILIGFSVLNLLFWGTPISGNPQWYVSWAFFQPRTDHHPGVLTIAQLAARSKSSAPRLVRAEASTSWSWWRSHIGVWNWQETMWKPWEASWLPKLMAKTFWSCRGWINILRESLRKPQSCGSHYHKPTIGNGWNPTHWL